MAPNDSLILSDPSGYKDFLRDAFRSKNKSVRKNLQGMERYQHTPLLTDDSIASLMEKKAFQLTGEEYIRLFHAFYSASSL